VRLIGADGMIVAPLCTRGHVLGALTAWSPSLSPADVSPIVVFAQQAATAYENAHLYAVAQQAVQLRDEFLSIAAHELKTPMTSLRNATGLVQRYLARDGSVEPERLSRLLGLVDEQTTKLGQLADRLLDTSRLDAGRLALDRSSVDLGLLVCGVVERAQLRTPTRRFRLNLGLPTCIQADPIRLEQVVTNLLDNAIKFSPEDSEIRVDLHSDAGDGVCLSVTDEGVGIPLPHRDRVFDRFYQVHQNGPNAGMGLGLFISREIVHLHGGTLTVESPNERGARFVVRLPVARN
jgi:signal transduction histidine kinase